MSSQLNSWIDDLKEKMVATEIQVSSMENQGPQIVESTEQKEMEIKEQVSLER